jgi:DNA-binding GntR family transcriptional regulator
VKIELEPPAGSYPVGRDDGGVRSLRRSERLRRSMAQEIASDLRNAILRGDIPAGAKLNQLRLAEQFEVSTTPVREALRLLEAQGLVRIDTYSGATVPVSTIDDLTNLYRIRLALCALVAESVVLRATPEQIAQANTANRELAAATDDSAFLEANQRLHSALDEAIGDPRLAQLWRHLSVVSAIYVKLSLPHRSAAQQGVYNEHARLIDAYANRDAAGIEAALVDHLTNTYEGCLLAMKQQADLAAEHGVVAGSQAANNAETEEEGFAS